MTDGQFHEAPLRENLEIYDRVGGGDSFASGLIYGFLAGKTPAAGGRIRRRPRRPGHDDPRRHHHGDAQGSRGRHEEQRRARHPVDSVFGRGTPIEDSDRAMSGVDFEAGIVQDWEQGGAEPNRGWWKAGVHGNPRSLWAVYHLRPWPGPRPSVGGVKR